MPKEGVLCSTPSLGYNGIPFALITKKEFRENAVLNMHNVNIWVFFAFKTEIAEKYLQSKQLYIKIIYRKITTMNI